MPNAQEWLYNQEEYNTPKKRSRITKLYISSKNLKGSLYLSDFVSLEKLYCSNNQLTSLNLNSCPQLTKIKCPYNQLTQLILPKNPNNLQILYCYDNLLTELDFTALNRESLTILSLRNNNFLIQDLNWLANFTQLNELYLGTTDKEKINQDKHDRWIGSLKPLKNLSKLKSLIINNTDINEGLEYLPNSLENFDCSADQRPDAKCQAIAKCFANEQWAAETDRNEWWIKNFPQKLQNYKQWRKLNFSEEEIQQWKEAGLVIDEYEFANYLRQKGYQPNTPNIKEIVTKESWKDIHQDFSYQLRKEWKGVNMGHAETKSWVEVNFQPNQLYLVKEWKDERFQVKQVKKWIALGFTSNELSLVQQWKRNFDCEEIKEWIALGFEPHNLSSASKWKAEFSPQETKELIEVGFKIDKPDQAKNWKDRGFDIHQTLEWINIGFKPEDANYAKQWRDENFTTEQANQWLVIGFAPNELDKVQNWKKYGLNCQEVKQLITAGFSKHDYEKFNQWKEKKFTVLQILEWITAGAKPDDYEFIAWLKDIKKANPEWVLNHSAENQKLKEKFKKYGLCPECNQPNTGSNQCQPCDSSSGNPKIDEFIQQYQSKTNTFTQALEWIPYKQFTEIEKIGEGGFGKVYKAKWKSGNIALKSLNNSQDTANFLQEITYHRLFHNAFSYIVKCYGISQDPKTKNYVMVMEYIKDGNLRRYLDSSYNQLSFSDKLGKLLNIAKGLNSIHSQKLIHRDFHAGNILNSSSWSYITDLGLCRPTNETSDSKVYGVLPYVAPEVLRSEPYTQASDIYSFGIIAYEILSGSPPYCDLPHGPGLSIKICEGLRPQLQIKMPPLLEDLIKKCWDADPEKRPATSELEKTLNNWWSEILIKKDTEFTRQAKEVEEFNKNLPKTDKKLKYTVHPSAIYTSRLLDFKNLPQPQNSKEINEQFYNDEGSTEMNFSEMLNKVESDLANISIGNQDWTNIRPDFTEELVKEWQNKGFTYEICKEWIDIGLKANEADYCAWLRDTKNLTPEQVLNHSNLNALKQEYQTTQQQAHTLQKTN